MVSCTVPHFLTLSLYLPIWFIRKKSTKELCEKKTTDLTEVLYRLLQFSRTLDGDKAYGYINH